MEKKIVSTLVNFRRSEIGAILAGFLLLGTCSLYAAETGKKENAFKQIASIEGRGALNFLTTPAEFAYTMKTEKKEHPKAWPATYIPRLFGNMVTRVASSANDFLILPWHAAETGATPLTEHFDLPEYVWEKQ